MFDYDWRRGAPPYAGRHRKGWLAAIGERRRQLPGAGAGADRELASPPAAEPDHREVLLPPATGPLAADGSARVSAGSNLAGSALAAETGDALSPRLLHPQGAEDQDLARHGDRDSVFRARAAGRE